MGSLMITSNIVPYIPKAKDLWVLRHFIINIEILVLQRGQLLQDEIPQLLLVQAKNLMMLIRQCLDKEAVTHYINVNRFHNPLLYVHETQYMLNNLDTPSIPKHTILLCGRTIPYIPVGYSLESCAFSRCYAANTEATAHQTHPICPRAKGHICACSIFPFPCYVTFKNACLPPSKQAKTIRLTARMPTAVTWR